VSFPLSRSCYIKPNIIIIVLLYSIIFYPDSTSTAVSVFIYMFMLSTNVFNLLFAASAGIIVNHVVRIVYPKRATMSSIRPL